jgi:hypothetical protein
VISLELATALRDAGLRWEPTVGDRFTIPDRGLDDETFVLSNMTIQVYELPQGAVIGFNGTTEWALDDIERDEAIWLPREDQLRGLLGDWFRRLERDGDIWTVVVDGQPDTVATSAEEAYGRAVLRTVGLQP